MSVRVCGPWFTGELHGGLVADGAGAGARVGRVAVVDAEVGVVPRRAVVDAQEEQLAARQQHPVRRRIVVGGDDRPPVAVPRHRGWRVALRLAVERRRLVADHELVFRVLHYARSIPPCLVRRTFSTNTTTSAHRAVA